MMQSRKILIVRLSSLGDIIHALPAFRSLRAGLPDARIDWVVEDRFAFLLRAVAGIDHVIPIDTRALRARPADRESWKRLLGPLRSLRASRYDAALDFQGLLKTALLARMSGAADRVGFCRELVREKPAHWFYTRKVAKPGRAVHVVRLNMLLAQEAGAPAGGLSAPLAAPEEASQAIETRLRQEQLSEFVVINPGGGWPTKCWQPARYGALASRIDRELGMRVVVTTGPGEEMLFREMAAACPGATPVHVPVPFLQLIPLYRRARLVVGGDTGPLHLACALGTPVVGIMGPTSPVRNGPWSDRDEAVVHPLPCSFCNGRTCPTANECMDIPVDEVFAAVVRRLERLP